MAVLLLPPIALAFGIAILLFWRPMFTVGLSLVVIGFLALLAVIGIGPSRSLRYGGYAARLERDLEEERAEEESD